MKTCSRPFTYFYLNKFDGDVWLCPWMHGEYGMIGNLFKSSAEEIWSSEKAEKIRQAFRCGDFLHICRAVACPMLQNDTLPDLTGENFEKLVTTRKTPAIVNLAHDYTCNQACETCRPHPFRPPADYKERIETINEKILPFINKAKRITLSGHGDPFASPYMMHLMEHTRPNNPDFKVLLETNGVFFDEKHWAKISHLGEFHCDASITVNSYDPFIYKQINKGGNYEKLMKNLNFISQLRKNEQLKCFSLGLVIQDKNFREMPSFIERSREQYHCDKVILKPVYPWGKVMSPDVFWFKDVLNPMHPYHAEYLELLEHPMLNEPYVYNFGGKTIHPATPFPGHSSNNNI